MVHIIHPKVDVCVQQPFCTALHSRNPHTDAHPSSGNASSNTPCLPTNPMSPMPVPRRVALIATLSTAAATLVPHPAHATKLGAGVDKAWEAMGGGPADLVFPEVFAEPGVWDVESTLVSVDTPLGLEFVPDSRVVTRAVQEDLNKPMRYRMRFIRNQQSYIVPDRQYNTASLMSYYMGGSLERYSNTIEWAVEDPNVLQLELPDGTSIRTRITRRSEDQMPEKRRLETSEYYEQVFQSPNRPQPRIKASQCFTKYLYRDAAAASGGPVIVATQVVSDYLTSYDDAGLLVAARGRPVVVYTYKMAFYPSMG